MESLVKNSNVLSLLSLNTDGKGEGRNGGEGRIKGGEGCSQFALSLGSQYMYMQAICE